MKKNIVLRFAPRLPSLCAMWGEREVRRKGFLWSTGWWSARNFKFNSWAEIEEASENDFGEKLSVIVSGFNQDFASVWKYSWQKCKTVAMTHERISWNLLNQSLVSIINAVRHIWWPWIKFQKNVQKEAQNSEN